MFTIASAKGANLRSNWGINTVLSVATALKELCQDLLSIAVVNCK